MRKILLKISLIVVPVAFMVAAVNYSVDPANLFSSREYVKGIADILTRGNNVNNVKNYDERLLQEQMFTRLKTTPDIIVLGSSRIMEIGNDFYPDKTLLNAGVSHANVHDLIAITGMMDSLGRLPKELIINVDHFLVSKDETTEWQSLFPYYKYFFEKYAREHHGDIDLPGSEKIRRLTSLVSFPYFKESLTFLITGADKKIYDSGKKRPQGAGRLHDGTVCYPDKYMYPDTARMGNVARATARKEGMSTADIQKIRLLRLLIEFLQEKNIKLHFLMLPYHNDYYNLVNKFHGNVLVEYDNLFRTMAKEMKIPLTGNFNPATGGFGALDFYDMYHCDKETIRKIIYN